MKHEEKLQEAKRLYKTANSDQKYVLESLFPELRESEDERIRKALIENFKFFGGDFLETSKWGKDDDLLVTDILAWLEKHGEQKYTDKVEPKFKVGDKIRRKTPSSCDKDMQVARIEKNYYICNHIGQFSSEVVPFSKESSYELIEQKPTDNNMKEALRTEYEKGRADAIAEMPIKEMRTFQKMVVSMEDTINKLNGYTED